MFLRKHLFQLIALILLSVVIGDLAYFATQADKYETNVFIYESECEEAEDRIALDFIPIAHLFAPIVSLISQPAKTESLVYSSGQFNFKPHGSSVPIFIDDCCFRI